MNFIKKVIAHSNEQEAPSLLNFDLFTDFSHANVKGDHLENHTPLAADLNVYIATLLGCDPLVISMVYFAGKTHDEGKASSIPDETLLSPRKLTRTERNVVNLHARKTVELTSAIHVFNNAVPCVGGMCSVNTINGHHHERFDGKGYEGIKNITQPEAIMVMGDSTSAMLGNERRYNRRSSELSEVIKRLLQARGTQFDPEMVSVFTTALAQATNDEYLNPDKTHIYALFEAEGLSAPVVTIEELFKYIEAYVDQRRTINPVINGVEYIIHVQAEDHIYSQDPDKGIITVFRGAPDSREKIAELVQIKYTFNLQEIYRRMHLTGTDLPKAKYLVTSAGQGLFKFSYLHAGKDEFYNRCQLFGGLSEDDLRIRMQNLLKDVISKDKINGFVRPMIDIMRKAGFLKRYEFLDDMDEPAQKLLGQISVLDHRRSTSTVAVHSEKILKDLLEDVSPEKQPLVRPVRKTLENILYKEQNPTIMWGNWFVRGVKYLNLLWSLKVHDDPRIRKNSGHIARGLYTLLACSGVRDIERKRAGLKEFWQEVKKKTILVKESALTQKEAEQLLPMIDYISKMNIRGISAEKVHILITALVDELYAERTDEERAHLAKELIETDLLFNYLAMISLLDEKHAPRKGVDVLENLNVIEQKCLHMYGEFPALRPILERIIEVCFCSKILHVKPKELSRSRRLLAKFGLSGTLNVTQPHPVVIGPRDLSREAFIVFMADSFISANANLLYFDKIIQDCPEKRALYAWLQRNERYLNPKQTEKEGSVIWSSIKAKNGLG